MPRGKKGSAPPCSIEGCLRPLFGNTYCEAHYRRWKRNGSAEVLPDWRQFRLTNRGLRDLGKPARYFEELSLDWGIDTAPVGAFTSAPPAMPNERSTQTPPSIRIDWVRMRDRVG